MQLNVEPAEVEAAYLLRAAIRSLCGTSSCRSDRRRSTWHSYAAPEPIACTAPLKDQQRRLNDWKRKSLEQLDARQAKWTRGGRKLRADQERRLTAEREEIETRGEARIRSTKDGMATVEQPYPKCTKA